MNSQKDNMKPSVFDAPSTENFAMGAKEVVQKMLKPLTQTVTELRKISEDCNKILDWVSSQPEKISEVLAQNVGPDYYSQRYIESIKRRLGNAKTALFYAYWQFAECAYTQDPPDEIAFRSSDPRAVFDVKTAVVDQLLLVKLPLLWSRYAAFLHDGKRCFATDSLRWFEWELRSALDKIRDQIPLYLNKNICYVHVVPKNSRMFADNDNYDTKHITDTIANSLLGTDNGLVCSFSYYGMQEGELPAGSYVIISPDLNAPPPLASLLPVLRSCFSKK